MTAAVKVQGPCLQGFLGPLLAVLTLASPTAAQSLLVERLGNGTVLVLVAHPMADVTSVAWPGNAADSQQPRSVTSGPMTLVVDLERALEEAGEEAPPVVVAVGGGAAGELRGVLERRLAGIAVAPVRAESSAGVIEGRVERRLGAPGSDASLRLEINLPAPADPLRTPIEVLWELLPELLDLDLVGLRTRIEGDLGVLEARIDSLREELIRSRLRLGLSRIADSPQLKDADVHAATARVLVRRRALLDRHPESATHLLGLWQTGGGEAVREFLFAADGVTTEVVREAARSWLPKHPGAVSVTLPPHAISPRFAAPPVMLTLDSGLSAAVLERPGAPLATVCLRPVVVPDLDGQTAAAVLTRLASELRTGPQRPGWVRVSSEPPQLELAGPPDGFAELLEALRRSVSDVETDQRAVALDDEDARRRALRLMAAILGAAEGAELSPATLLRPENLALGIVAPDAEAAADAVRKFWNEAPSRSGPVVKPLETVTRTRAAVAGNTSTLVVALTLPVGRNEALAPVVLALLETRGAALWGEEAIEILQPFVPGRQMLVLTVTRVSPLHELEADVEARWSELVRAAGDDELAAVRRRAAAAQSELWSGPTGRARRSAAVAAGTAWWRPTAELETAILSLGSEEVTAALAASSELGELLTTAAGVMPIVDLDEKPAATP